MSSLNFNGNVTVGRDINVKQSTITKNLESRVKEATSDTAEQAMLMTAIQQLTELLENNMVQSNSEASTDTTVETDGEEKSFKDTIIDTFTKIGSVSTELLGTVISNVITNITNKYM